MNIETAIHNIDISITKAKLEGIAFTLRDEGVPHITVGLSLLSVGGNKVTDVSLGTNAWQEGSKLRVEDIPVEVYDHLRNIRELLIPVCVRKINSIDKFIAG